MKADKKLKSDLSQYTKLFLLLGLVGALLLVQVALETKTYEKVTTDIFEQAVYDGNEELDIPETKIEIERPKQITPVAPEPILENIKIISDDKDIEETVLESSETDETQAVVIKEIPEVQDIKEVEIEEEVVEDVPFFIIEQVPVYPGCKGNKEELRKCMQQKIKEHVAKNFNVDLAQDLGLTPGVKRIFVMFVIDKNGTISGVQSRAPHKSLQKEGERVIKSLPKMKPGEQRGRPVGVRYSLPIVFEVL
jgi:protein TonB